MTSLPWEPLGATPPSDLKETRLELHWAAQIVGAAGVGWGEELPAYRHHALEWVPETRVLSTLPSNTNPAIRAGLHVERAALVVADAGGKELDAWPLAGRSLAEGADWMRGAGAKHAGLEPEALVLPDHDMPAHPVGDGAPFGFAQREDDGARAELARYYANMHALLGEVRRADERAREAVLWPHHFDMAVLIELDPMSQGEDARSVGVGLSPGDGSYAEPYWYVAPWPYPPQDRLSTLTGGHWHVEGFTGAVLTGSELLAGTAAQPGDASAQADAARAFVRTAIEASLAALA